MRAFCFSTLAAALLTALPLAVAQPLPAAANPLVADSKSPASAPPGLLIPPPPPREITTEMRGDIAMARKMYREAIDIYRSIQPETAVSLNKIGIAHHHLTELHLARRSYERALKLKRDYAEAVNNLGTVHYATKNYRRAISYYNKALKISPNSASIWSNLGTAWFARRNYRKASEAYQKALELDPEVFEHRNSSAGTVLQERSVEERAKFHFYLSKTYAKAGAAERALIYMRKALEEGFKDRKRFVEDPEFAAMQQLPEFQELLTLQPRVL